MNSGNDWKDLERQVKNHIEDTMNRELKAFGRRVEAEHNADSMFDGWTRPSVAAQSLRPYPTAASQLKPTAASGISALRPVSQPGAALRPSRAESTLKPKRGQKPTVEVVVPEFKLP